MTEIESPIEKLLGSLQERAKELNCLYEVERILAQLELPPEEAFQAVVDVIPPGWQYPDVCRAMIEYGAQRFVSGEFEPTNWVQRTDIVVQDSCVGTLSVYYVEERPKEAIGPFLKEEERLIKTIAERLGHFILYHELRDIHLDLADTRRILDRPPQSSWQGPVDLLRRTDRDLYLRIARKMVNHLCWAGVDGAQELLEATYSKRPPVTSPSGEHNEPGRFGSLDESSLLSGAAFELASRALGGDAILELIQDWIMEDKASFLPKVLNNTHSPVAEIAEALRRFHLLLADGAALSLSTINGLRVQLIRRFLTEQLEFISVAKENLETSDFITLLDGAVLSNRTHCRVGGKSAGLFVAQHVLRRHASEKTPVGNVKVPRSWYVASEAIMEFIEYNDLEEVLQQKYRGIAQVRLEYPNIIQLFKASRFPPDFVKAISMTLDELRDQPIIVRSSSLLEDRLGSAFSGKYKSLFLANQGSKQQRIAALLDAITEVYASMFGPDPIAYRQERGLLDFHEEMGILVQEVVGTQVGRYFLPALAGVAYSKNEFRWSSRIQREDGLIRMVPGLGTRAVDRVSDDYPIMVVPGQPTLRVNATIDEVVRYSPKKIDVINLESGCFETVDLRDFIREQGAAYPGFAKVFSVLKDQVLRKTIPLLVDPENDEFVADFSELIASTPFVANVRNILKILESALRVPVDIEFAFDGDDFYLLQCRPQGFAAEDAPAPIPRDIPERDILFSARRYISNGRVPEITHLVYVDPTAYAALAHRGDMLKVGTIIGEINKLLPKRQFILMGPGRWGSRGDIKLGVNVTYSDINNSAMLIEIARQTGNFKPDLSFGTHFFQDLVESSIRYLPLYPDEDCFLDEKFLARAPNLLEEMLPAYGELSSTVHVIDVVRATHGKVLHVLMNSDLDEAVAFFADPEGERHTVTPPASSRPLPGADVYWRWRLQMAERIAAEIEAERFAVQAVYVIGSTKNATAGPASDIDLLIHFTGSEAQLHELTTWLEGWSLCLAEMNFLRTGYRCPDLLDVHIVTDDDIARKTSFAAKIGAATDAARELPLGKG